MSNGVPVKLRVIAQALNDDNYFKILLAADLTRTCNNNYHSPGPIIPAFMIVTNFEPSFALRSHPSGHHHLPIDVSLPGDMDSLSDSAPKLASLSGILLSAVIISFVSYRISACISRRGRSPPGPPGLPIIGNALQIPADHQWLKWHEWKQKYGACLGLSGRR